MAVRSAAPKNAPLVYTILTIIAVLAAMGGAALMGIIVYNYVTRPELRNPVPQEGATTHGELPAWIQLA